MAMMHSNIMTYYETIFALKQYHGWAMEEVENCLPWELEVFVSLLNNYLETRKLQEHQRQASLNS